MNEEQINALVAENKMLADRLTACEEMLKACMEKIANTDNFIQNELLNPLVDAFNTADDKIRFDDFTSRFGERLSPYSQKLSAIEGKDVDAVRDAYNAYNSYTDEERAEFENDEKYIDDLITELDTYINKVRETLGVSPDTDVAIKSDEEGKMEIAVDGEPIAEAEKNEVVEEVGEVPGNESVEEETTETTATEEEPKEEELDENTKFYNELLKDRAKYMR